MAGETQRHPARPDSSPWPKPVVNSWSRPFWEATRRGELMVQKCGDCGRHIFYPRQSCPFCFGEKLGWVEVSGRGVIYSSTVVMANAPSAFAADVPYVVAVISLDEGVRMLSNIVDCPPENVVCEMPVEVVFVRRDEEFTMPMFRPRKGV